MSIPTPTVMLRRRRTVRIHFARAAKIFPGSVGHLCRSLNLKIPYDNQLQMSTGRARKEKDRENAGAIALVTIVPPCSVQLV
jgi:hypothetical protein